MNEELLNNLGSLGLSRAMQQKIRKVPGAQLGNMLQKYGAFEDNSEPLSTKEQLRRKIREKQNMRMGRQMSMPENKKDEVPSSPILTEEEKAKKHKNKIRRLRQKYGQVSDEDYYEALEKTQGVDLLKMSKNESEQYHKYFNLIDLYNHQHRDKEEERELELDDF